MTVQSRRKFLTRILIVVSAIPALSACGFGKEDTQAAQALTTVLRHHGMAAHLGRLQVESDPTLESMSFEQLIQRITKAIDLDFDTLLDADPSTIAVHIQQAVRQDFTDENVVAVDGWLLSTTEADICALLYRNIQQSSA